jgi:ribose transport system ATP-binding protein
MSDILVEMRHITKTFPGVVALDDVTFECRKGKVHAVVGENGAGKSTLMKILAGVYQPDQGEIVLRGESVRIRNPHEAQRMGISIIYQELNLLPDLSVAANVFLGREPRSPLGFLNAQELEEGAQEVLHRLGVDINPRTRVGRLSVAQQQLVEIAKALSLNAELIIMDEPSATLGGQDLEHVFEVISTLKEQNVAVVYISHRIAEVFEIADRVTVFKDGKLVGTENVSDIERGSLVRMMIGRTLSETFPPRGTDVAEEIVTIKDLSSSRVLNGINLSVHRGEIVGLSGLMGAGRTELAQVIFGARPIDEGSIHVGGRQVKFSRPADALRHNMGFLTENRKEEGLVHGLPVIQNVALPSLKQRQNWGFVQRRKENQVGSDMVAELDCRTPGLGQEVQYLSGGNQQKVVLAKWLISGPDILIFDEPTRGIDVGAKSEIWHLMRELANQGTAILMISSELPEIIGMSDRVVVMHRGRIAGVIPGETATEEEVMYMATYGEQHG